MIASARRVQQLDVSNRLLRKCMPPIKPELFILLKHEIVVALTEIHRMGAPLSECTRSPVLFILLARSLCGLGRVPSIGERVKDRTNGNGIAAALGSEIRQHPLQLPEVFDLASDVGDVLFSHRFDFGAGEVVSTY